MKQIKHILLPLLALLSVKAFPQSPEFYPPVKPEPVEFDWLSFFLYIIGPLLLITASLLYRRYQKKQANKKKNNNHE